MHIPDGFLDVKTWVGTYALSAGALGYSIKKSKETLDDRMIPRLGIMAAFIFAAQMVNFPVAGGTSGHLLGAALATVLLGPYSASLILSAVLFIQCIAFQDGGLTALGGNIFNMAIAGVIIAQLVFSLIKRIIPGVLGKNLAVFAAAWASVLAASALAALELGISGTVPLNVGLPAMAAIHAVIGIGEGLITLVVVNFIEKAGFIPKASTDKAQEGGLIDE